MQIEDSVLAKQHQGFNLDRDELENKEDAYQQFSKSSLCPSVPDTVNIFHFPAISTLAYDRAHRYANFTSTPLAPVDNGQQDWEFVLEETALRLYRRRPEKGDTSSFDTYQIRSTIEGISAKELCRYFWDPAFRMEWEVSIDTPPSVLLQANDTSCVIHQFFTTIWPVKHRYSIFYSTLQSLPKASEDVLSRHYVVNYSTNYPLCDETANKTASKMIFAFLDVVLVAETRLRLPHASDSGDHNKETIKREDIVTEVAYVCRIDPGGWIPASLAKMTSRKEYPRFFKRLVKCVADKCKECRLEL